MAICGSYHSSRYLVTKKNNSAVWYDPPVGKNCIALILWYFFFPFSDIMDSKWFYGRKIAPIPDDCEDDDSTDSDNPSETSSVSSYAPDELSSKSLPSDAADDCETFQQDNSETTTNSLWINDTWTVPSAASHSFPFSGREVLYRRPTSTAAENKIWPIDVFQLFVSDDVVDFIVDETNHFATQVLQLQTLTIHSRLKVWSPTNRDEMKRFLGMVIYMEVIQFPEISFYWSKKQLYCGIIIPKTMDRDQFQIVVWMLHFVDNFSSSTSTLAKIYSFMGKLIHNFQTFYTPGSALVVDETTVPFHGRVKFCQYITGKSHGYGCNIFKFCTVDSYTWNFEAKCFKMSRNTWSYRLACSKIGRKITWKWCNDLHGQLLQVTLAC